MRTWDSDPEGFRGMVIMEYWHGVRGSVRLRTREFHHLCPLLGFVSDELAEFGGRHRHRHAAQIGEPPLDRWIGEARGYCLFELVDDLRRRVLGNAAAIPEARLVARQELPHGGMSGSASERVAVVTASARSLPALIYPIDATVVGKRTRTSPPNRSLYRAPPPP